MIPSNCQTSGAKDGASHTIKPGKHCNVNFNGSPKITFEPGLHIIDGSMNINSGATVIAEDVTFFFTKADSGIQFNGGLTIKGSAPTTGPYAGFFMFEKPESNRRNFVFNGSVNEDITGVVYLPNRDVTYNSTTNQTNEMTLVVNTLIMNSANWNLKPYAGGSAAAGGAVQNVRLVNYSATIRMRQARQSG